MFEQEKVTRQEKHKTVFALHWLKIRNFFTEKKLTWNLPELMWMFVRRNNPKTKRKINVRVKNHVHNPEETMAWISKLFELKSNWALPPQSIVFMVCMYIYESRNV